VVALFGAVPIGFWAEEKSRAVDWYRHRPTHWVIDDLGSPSSGTAARAQAELDRRIAGKRLSSREHEILTEKALKEQASAKEGPSAEWLMQYVAGRELLGERGLSEGQRTRFFRQMFGFKLTVLPQVVAGQPLVAHVIEIGRAPRDRAPNGGWIGVFEVLEWRVNGKRIAGRGGPGHSYLFEGSGNEAASATMPMDLPVGRHTVECVMRIRLQHGIADGQEVETRSDRTETLTTSCEVLARGRGADLNSSGPDASR
jgi:hypothetical protein